MVDLSSLTHLEILTGNLTFSQQQVLDQQIRFSQQGAGKPGYQVSVTDGRITLPPAIRQCDFLCQAGINAKSIFSEQ